MSRSNPKILWAALIALFALMLAGTVFAQPLPGNPPRRVTPPPGAIEKIVKGLPQQGGTPQIKLRVEGKRHASVEMVREGNLYSGWFWVANDGLGQLNVTRLGLRTSAADPRLPAGVSVAFEDGKTNAVIPPNSSKRAVVRWEPEKAPAIAEVYGHVIAESDTADHKVAAIGIHAERQLGPVPWLFNHILSWLTFLPLLGMLAIFGLYLQGYKKDENLRWLGVGLMSIELVLAGWLYWAYQNGVGRAAGNDGFQFIEHGVWIRSLNVEYFIGVDGTSISMVLLTALVSFVAALASFSVKKSLKGYWAMFFLLVTGMMGVFVSLDLFLFYMFWEVMLLPMYFLIGVWGGPRKEYAAIKFFLYTLAGSVFMLLAFIAMYYNADPSFLVDGTPVAHTFSIPELMRVDFAGKNLTILGLNFVKLIWVVLFIGFAIKVPMFPFHTWLPDAHVEAPTAISVILAGVLLKMGVYGMLRINFGILPEATQWAATAIAVFGVINILYGAFCAMAQEDLKRLVAYSSVSHMGYCLLGMAALTPHGIEAAIVQMFNHGTITSMLFALVGVIYDRAHTREIGKFGGMASEMPFYTAFFGFAFMASLGLPGLSGFIGEALTFVGAFPVFPLLTILAASGVIFTAAYHLWAMQRIFLGKFREEWRTSHALEEWKGRFPEMTLRETLTLAPMGVIVLVLGFWPRPLLNLIDVGVSDLTALVNPPGASQIAHLGDVAHKVLALLP